MHFSVKWFDGKYPQFNLQFHKAEGQPEFFSVKGLRIMNGQNGEFVSYPSQKQESGKYWNHAWGDEKFNAFVLELANKSRPSRNEPQQSRQAAPPVVEDVPF